MLRRDGLMEKVMAGSCQMIPYVIIIIYYHRLFVHSFGCILQIFSVSCYYSNKLPCLHILYIIIVRQTHKFYYKNNKNLQNHNNSQKHKERINFREFDENIVHIYSKRYPSSTLDLFSTLEFVSSSQHKKKRIK